jgi:hypothetical protein
MKEDGQRVEEERKRGERENLGSAEKDSTTETGGGRQL